MIGLDIGSSAVRAAELEPRRGGRPRLTRYGEVRLPPGAVIDGDVVEPAVVAGAIRTLWGDAGFHRRDVAVGLASHRVTVRELALPDLPEAELAHAVRLQAQDELPMPVEEAVLDYVVIERSGAAEGPRTVRLLLVAAEKEMVERLLTAVTSVRLRPVLVDLDAFALLRSVATGNGAGGQTELIVDIGATVTKIAVHRDRSPLFVRMVRLGGDAATRQIQQALELSWDDAEKAKLGASGAMAAGVELDPDDERVRVVQSGMHRVVTEIRHSLEFFKDQHDDVEVDGVVLSGGGSLAPGLAEQLHAGLDLPVAAGDPLRAVDSAPRRGEPLYGPTQGPFLAVPIGLALGLAP